MDGFEVFVPPQSADRVWIGHPGIGQGGWHHAVRPRRATTARLEAGSRLQLGTDIDETTTAVEAGLSGSSVGKRRSHRRRGAAMIRRRLVSKRKLVGFRDARPRHRATGLRRAYVGDTKAGSVTSGTQTCS